jgi:GT2 family glycosyltransferase
MKILIPTYKSHEEIQPLIAEIQSNSPDYCTIYASCQKVSAAVNRNLCLSQITVGDMVIMLDDDICGFYHGWVDDLVAPIHNDYEVIMVSARLLKQDGSFGPTCSGCLQSSPEDIVVPRNRLTTLPTAAIAFIHYGYYFDENFRGSGWEDNDWCLKYRQGCASAKFIQTNRCKLIHLNQMKEQKGENWNWNRNYFRSQWPHIPEITRTRC